MPTQPVISTTYAGQFAGKYISAALLSAPTIEIAELPLCRTSNLSQLFNVLKLQTF